MNCTTCHSPLEPDQSSCPVCGAPAPVASAPSGVPPEPVDTEPQASESVAAEERPRCAVHPDAVAQTACSRCGTFACRACLVTLSSGQQVCQACAPKLQETPLPWDRRDELGLLKAWWQTCVQVMGSPDRTFAQTSPQGTLGSSLLFSVLSNIAGILTTMVLYLLFFGGLLISAMGSEFPKVSGLVWGAIGVGALFAYLLFLAAFGAVAVLILAGIEHLMLKLLGADPKPYDVTVRGHALSMSPYLVGLVPVCGLYIYPIWSIVVRVFAYKHFHRITGGKAVAAILLPVAVLVAVVVVGYLILIAAMVGLRGANAT